MEVGNAEVGKFLASVSRLPVTRPSSHVWLGERIGDLSENERPMTRSHAIRFAMPSSDQGAKRTRPEQGRPQSLRIKALRPRRQKPLDRAVLFRTACCG